MGIQQCKNCGTKFNYIDLQKSFWSGYRPIICRNCGAGHAWKRSYRIIIATIMVLPLIYVLFSLQRTFGTLNSIFYSTVFYILYATLMSGLYPFIVRYDLEDQWR